MYIVLKTTSDLKVTAYGTMEGKPFRSERPAQHTIRLLEQREITARGESTFLVLEVHALDPALYAPSVPA
jgi:hypothetical protein